jgi:cob(I)alamin adenosyltransferase
MSIITGRGDSGETDLLFGKRIAKTSGRIGALGAVDELNAALGLARASGLAEELEQIVDHVQEKLVGLMGQVACLPEDAGRYDEKGYAKVLEEDVKWLEEKAHDFEGRGIRFTGWARPGVEHSVARAGLDVARAVARRAERQVWRLHEECESVPEPVRLYFNRLSDLLWILARADAPK